jgi:hypothetical protein
MERGWPGSAGVAGGIDAVKIISAGRIGYYTAATLRQ